MDANLLLLTAASIAVIHTILGPDHYLVFVAMAKARAWSMSKTLRVTLYCGIGHVLGSVAIGTAGIVFGAQLNRLIDIESTRGTLAGWTLLAFGLVYFVWGLKKAFRGRRHAHLHSHGDIVHSHEHDHSGQHAHVHLETAGSNITPWAIFIIFVLGPCEALIPLFMYPAALESGTLVVAVAVVFGLTTLLTMLCAVAVSLKGLERFRWPALSRYSHAIAGASIVVCGSAINFLGL